MTKTLQNELASRHDIPFMPVDIDETNDYANNIAHYVLHLYGPLINGQKAVTSTNKNIKTFENITFLRLSSLNNRFAPSHP